MLKTWRNNFEWEGGGRSVLYLACSRHSDSRARRSVGSELNCTPGKRGGGRGGLPPLVSPRFFSSWIFLPRSTVWTPGTGYIISHRPVTSSDLKQERSFFRGSVSTFLQLVVAENMEYLCRFWLDKRYIFSPGNRTVIFFKDIRVSEASKCAWKSPHASCRNNTFCKYKRKFVWVCRQNVLLWMPCKRYT